MRCHENGLPYGWRIRRTPGTGRFYLIGPKPNQIEYGSGWGWPTIEDAIQEAIDIERDKEAIKAGRVERGGHRSANYVTHLDILARPWTIQAEPRPRGAGGPYWRIVAEGPVTAVWQHIRECDLPIARHIVAAHNYMRLLDQDVAS